MEKSKYRSILNRLRIVRYNGHFKIDVASSKGIKTYLERVVEIISTAVCLKGFAAENMHCGCYSNKNER